MKLNTMLVDFVKRAKTSYTPVQIKEIMKSNPTIVTEDALCIFRVSYDELHILFMYVRPGVNAIPYKDAMELFGKMHGCKVAKFVTKRDKAFARRFPDYKPCAVMFEKNL